VRPDLLQQVFVRHARSIRFPDHLINRVNRSLNFALDVFQMRPHAL